LARARGGTAPFGPPFENQEGPMIKTILTPVVLGLVVAMLIRVAMAGRA
jgi:hypothetical protein